MAYTINLTDGAIFATIPDGTIDTSSSMILVGKNYAGYGEFLDENFVHLLENGANNVPPSAPLTGQLWWDKSTNQMKVYSGTAFKIISGATNSATAPSNNVVGDLWWDTVNNQLRVWNGTEFKLVGPATTAGEGESGAIVTTVTDNVSVQHVVIQLFVDNVIVGIFSKDSTFTPQTAITGFATISPGLQLSSTVPSALFRGTATNSQLLDTLAPSAFMRTNTNTSTSGTLGVLNDTGLTVGLDQDAKLSVITANSEVVLQNQTQDANVAIRVNDGGVNTTVLAINGATSEATFTNPVSVPAIVKTGADAVGNIGTAGTRFNTVFATTFEGTVANATNVTGTVAAANGGTGRNTLNANSLVLGNGTGAVNFVAPGTSGNILQSNGTTWASASPLGAANGGTGRTTLTAGSVVVGDGTSQVALVAPGTNGNVLTAQGGTWVSQAGGGGGGGSVSSVALTAPTGFSIAGSPVTTSGTLALSFAAGYSLPTTASQATWDTAFADRFKWDGSSTGLTASTGRTSLGLGSMATETATDYVTVAGNVTISGTKTFSSILSTNYNFSGFQSIGITDGSTVAINTYDVSSYTAARIRRNGSGYPEINLGLSSTAGMTEDTGASPDEFEVGYIGINTLTITNSAGGNAFFTAGNVGKSGGGTFYDSSDSRLKTNVRDYQVGLETIVALQPKRYDLLDRRRKVRYGVDRVEIKDHVGLVAQDVQQTDLAEMVFEGADGYLNIENTKLWFAMINAIKELNQEVTALRTELDVVKSGV